MVFNFHFLLKICFTFLIILKKINLKKYKRKKWKSEKFIITHHKPGRRDKDSEPKQSKVWEWKTPKFSYAFSL